MKKTAKFILILYIVVYLVLAVLYSINIIDYLFLYSAIVAGILNLVNSVIAILLVDFSYKKDNKTFLIANVGGMGIRMVLILSSILLIVKFLKIHEIGFLLIFFVFYFILLSSEVLHFHKQIKNKNI